VNVAVAPAATVIDEGFTDKLIEVAPGLGNPPLEEVNPQPARPRIIRGRAITNRLGNITVYIYARPNKTPALSRGDSTLRLNYD
jgi:hypothetical protein